MEIRLSILNIRKYQRMKIEMERVELTHRNIEDIIKVCKG